MEKENLNKHDIQRSKVELLSINKRRLEEEILFLSDDIREYQRKIKFLGQQNKTVEALSKKITTKLCENNYEIIQAILTKKKRSNDDLNIIKTFLSTMKYLSSMTSILDTDKILFSLSIYLKMEKKTKDSILFRFGNRGTKFYILFTGQVTILILKETFVKISFMKFILHLIMLKCLGEDEMVKKIIIANYQNRFHLDEKSFDNMYEKIVLMGNKIIEKKNKNRKKEEKVDEEEEESEEEFEEDVKIEKENEDFNNNGIKRNKTLQLNYLVSNYNGFLNSKNYKYVKTNFKNENLDNYDLPLLKRFSSSKANFRNSRKSVIQSSNFQPNFLFFHKDSEIQEITSYYVYLKEKIGNIKKMKFSIPDYINDTYIDSSYAKQIDENLYKDKEKYIIYKYHDIVKKNKGDTFGELALQHEDNKRTATIITNSNCILGYLSKSAYETCLSEIELKRRKNEVNFIMSFSIFDQMNWISFENKYFNYFKREFCPQHETIIKQGETIKKVFFIMDGQFEINTSLSIGGIFKIIRQKRKEALKNYQIRLNKNKNRIRLAICNNKDIIGLNDCVFTNEFGQEVSFVNVTCISTKSIIFTLDKNILDGLKKKIPEINKNLKEIINKREKILVDRLITIFNLYLKRRELFINYKFDKDNKKNKFSKKPKKIFAGNKTPNMNIKKDKNLMKEETSLSNKNRLHSANINKITLLSQLEYNKKKSIDESKLNISPNIKANFFTDDSLYKAKMSSEKLTLKNNFGTIFANKDSNKKISNNKIYLRTPLSAKESNNKEIIKDMYPPLNKMINREYNKLFNFIDEINNSSEIQKLKLKNDENIQISEKKKSKKQSYDYGEENKNDKNNIPLDNSKKFIENDSLSLIKNDKNNIKNQKLDYYNNIKDKMRLNILPKNSFNNINSKSINKSSFVSFHEENKINNNNSLTNKQKIKAKTISNETYLKQILGTRYRDRDDEFITYEEKKFMKTINDYDTNLIRMSKMKLKFKRKMKKK